MGWNPLNIIVLNAPSFWQDFSSIFMICIICSINFPKLIMKIVESMNASLDSIPLYAYRAAYTNKLEFSIPFSGWDPIFDSLEFNAYLIELHNCTLNIERRIVDYYVFPSPLYRWEGWNWYWFFFPF